MRQLKEQKPNMSSRESERTAEPSWELHTAASCEDALAVKFLISF